MTTSTSRGTRVPTLAAIAITVITAMAALLAEGRAASAASQAAPAPSFAVYGVTTRTVFVNHADDRQRGVANNPFNLDVPPETTKTDETGSGPFAGDRSIFSVKLYANAGLTKSAGVAWVSCNYVFDKNAICETTLQLIGGMVFASGPTIYGNTSFSLGITAGTGKYRGVRGQLDVTRVPGAASALAQKYSFVLS